jgi:hypothetical protein
MNLIFRQWVLPAEFDLVMLLIEDARGDGPEASRMVVGSWLKPVASQSAKRTPQEAGTWADRCVGALSYEGLIPDEHLDKSTAILTRILGRWK